MRPIPIKNPFRPSPSNLVIGSGAHSLAAKGITHRTQTLSSAGFRLGITGLGTSLGNQYALLLGITTLAKGRLK